MSDPTASKPKKPRTPRKKANASDPPPPPPPASSGESEGSGDDDDVVVGEVATDLGDEGGVSLEPAVVTRASGLDRYDPFKAYLSEVQRHPLLTPDEEHELAARYAKTGDVKAAARMVTANLRLVVKIAYEYRRAYRNLMDIVQEGNIGLMQAVKRYDPYRGVKLSTYAAWWIRAYILRFIVNNWRLVKLGTTQTQRKLFFNLNKEKQRLAQMGIDPSSAELARRLDVPESEVVDMDRRLSGNDMSLDAPVGDSEGRALARVDTLPSGGRGADEMLAGAEIDDMVRERLVAFEKTLTGKDVDIFRDRFMADDPVTLQEIGDRYGISRERVRQLEKRLQDKLRAYLQGELGRAIDLD
ncbi:MAG: RNA polymerase factor sigma-32 [Polyangiales bacterium]